MPFLALPRDESELRFQDDQVVFHYLVSTPSCRTFVNARTHASSLAASLTNPIPTDGGGTRTEDVGGVELDASYPIMLFLPSECFSVAHLFADQLCDATLSAHFNLVAVDPRGHGLTRDVPIRDPSRKYDLDIKAADILAFTRLLLSHHSHHSPTPSTSGGVEWARGIHILACSMSGLVAARMAAKWPTTFSSIMITSPILELESPFMVESFQGIKQLLEESWHQLHTSDSSARIGQDEVKLPGEVVQGFTFRWAGGETIPAHIASYLSRTWLERLVLHERGLEAARDWWFDLYWLRRPMDEASRLAVRCKLLVVEGDRDLPYERNVAEDIAALFPNARCVHVDKVERAPFLLSVKRPHQLTQAICTFLGIAPAREPEQDESTTQQAQEEVVEMLLALEPPERFELVKVYAPELVADAESDDGSEQSDDDSEPDESHPSSVLRHKRVPTLHASHHPPHAPAHLA